MGPKFERKYRGLAPPHSKDCTKQTIECLNVDKIYDALEAFRTMLDEVNLCAIHHIPLRIDVDSGTTEIRAENKIWGGLG